MDHSNKKKPKLLPVSPNWSDLCPDLLQTVFKRLSFTELIQAKSVCKSWNSASRGCVPKPNKIPWLILFPQKNQTNNNNNNNSSAALFIPDDKHNLYKTQDLGVGFTKSSCLATHGSWLLMFDNIKSLYILNPLTLERIDLPSSLDMCPRNMSYNLACLCVDDITKDYLVVWFTGMALVYTKKGDITWRIMQVEIGLKYRQIICNRKDQKVYLYIGGYICVWDLSGDIPRRYACISAWRTADNCYPTNFKRINIATTVSGDLLQIDCAGKRSKWRFHIHKFDFPNERWVKIDSLGDEALILDTGLTVVAKDIPWMKRNTVYFSGLGNTSNDCIFIYDLAFDLWQTAERCLPQSVLASMRFSDARWFLPGYNA